MKCLKKHYQELSKISENAKKQILEIKMIEKSIAHYKRQTMEISNIRKQLTIQTLNS